MNDESYQLVILLRAVSVLDIYRLTVHIILNVILHSDSSFLFFKYEICNPKCSSLFGNLTLCPVMGLVLC